MKRLCGTTLIVTIMFLGLAVSAARADTSALISSLTSGLGVTGEQATGGAGAIFDFAKSKMSAADFSTVSAGLPGVDSLIGAAPKVDSGSTLSSLGSLGGSSAGAMTDLVGRFDTLGLSADSIKQFVPVILDYAKSEGGQQVMSLLKGALL